MDAPTIDALGRLVGAVGFPVATATMLLWWVLAKLNGKLDEHTRALEEQTKAVSQNTQAILHLADKVETFLK